MGFVLKTISSLLISLITSCYSSEECEVFLAPPAVCPGRTAEFTCISFEAEPAYGQTTWVVSESTAPQYGCPLFHSEWPNSNNTVQCGSFLGRSITESPADCYNSELTVTAVLALNNTSVVCLFVPILGNRRVGNGTLEIIGPVETTIETIRKNDIHFGNGSDTGSVDIHWSITDNRNITQYIVRIHPSSPPCSGVGRGVCVIDEGDSGFNSRELSLQIELGIEYNVTVSTVNCGTQAGIESDPVTILLYAPSSPTCQVWSFYRDNILFGIEVAWNKQLVHNILNLSGVDFYTVTIDPSIISHIMLPAKTSCNNYSCHHILDFSPLQFNKMDANISVRITAHNAVGVSQPALCNPQVIGIRSPVSVDSTTGPHVRIVIRFLPNYKSKACNVTYGTNTTLQTSSSSIHKRHNEIEYILDLLIVGATYDYDVSCLVAMELDDELSEFKFTNRGKFSAGCFLCDLIPNKNVIISVNQLCLELPNGLVCYNGHLPGAIAVYICNKDYILHGDSTRECGQNGLWSGQAPQCQFNLNSTSSPTIPIREPESEDCEDVNLPISTMAAILITASTVVGIVSCVIGALFHRTVSSLSFSCRTGAKKVLTQPQHIYDEVTLNTHAQSDFTTADHDPSSSTFHMTADVEMCANRAYIHVNRVA